ncbi:MAG: DUF4880 domain-containing protein [Alphaproteobacteria bacterium]|nr:MAG: DUF4880 domain-containing protein [Alphaproteobacteria bacterium]
MLGLAPAMSGRDVKARRSCEEAARWCVLIASGKATDGDKARFAEWLMAAPNHLREFQTVESLWNQTRAYGDDLDPERGVIALFPGMERNPGQARPSLLKRGKRLFMSHVGKIAASLIVLLASLAFALTDARLRTALWAPQHVYQTKIGESRLVRLADGSIIELNTASRIAVRMTAHARTLTLERGEAYFVVAKDRARPFIVAADGAYVRAVGTEFNVKAVDRQVAVTVVEGTVLVANNMAKGGYSGQAMTWRQSLTRNQQLIVRRVPGNDRHETLVSNQVNAKNLVAWREKKLIFDAVALREVVADFNRYNETTIAINDASLGALAISGVFDPRDPVAFARTVAMFPNVEMVELGRSRIILGLSHD